MDQGDDVLEERQVTLIDNQLPGVGYRRVSTIFVVNVWQVFYLRLVDFSPVSLDKLKKPAWEFREFIRQ